jgi:hypothetical protein
MTRPNVFSRSAPFAVAAGLVLLLGLAIGHFAPMAVERWF